MFHLLVKCVEIVQGVDTSQNEGNLQAYFNDSQDELKVAKKESPIIHGSYMLYLRLRPAFGC